MKRLVILLPMLAALGCATPAPQLNYANGVISIAGLGNAPRALSPAPLPKMHVGALICGRNVASYDPT